MKKKRFDEYEITNEEWRSMGFNPNDPGDWAAMSNAAGQLRRYLEGEGEGE
jgi:hypothetical protein